MKRDVFELSLKAGFIPMWSVVESIVIAFTYVHSMFEPALARSSEILHFKFSDILKIRVGITFIVYLGLPHIH